MHKRANEIQNHLGGNQWPKDNSKSVEEKAYRKLHPQAD